MRKALIVFASLLLMLLSISLVLEVVTANPFPPRYSYINVDSPQLNDSPICPSTTFQFTIELNLLKDDASNTYPWVTEVTYSLDDQDNVTISDIPRSGREYTVSDTFGGLHQTAHYIAIEAVNATLSDLSEGKHTVDVYAFDIKGGVLSTTAVFEVLTTYQIPEVTLLSPKEDQQYGTSEIPLTFVVDGEYTQLCYAIDYLRTGSNVTIKGNTTVNISGLHDGYHEIRVYATTPNRHGGLAAVYFLKNSSAPTPDPAAQPTASPTPTVEPTEPAQVNQPLEILPASNNFGCLCNYNNSCCYFGVGSL
jgi:hypothetical protein